MKHIQNTKKSYRYETREEFMKDHCTVKGHQEMWSDRFINSKHAFLDMVQDDLKHLIMRWWKHVITNTLFQKKDIVCTATELRDHILQVSFMKSTKLYWFSKLGCVGINEEDKKLSLSSSKCIVRPITKDIMQLHHLKIHINDQS